MNKTTEALVDAIMLHHRSLVESLRELSDEEIEANGGKENLGRYIAVGQGVLAAMHTGAMLGSFCASGEFDDTPATKAFLMSRVMENHLSLVEMVGSCHMAASFGGYLDDLQEKAASMRERTESIRKVVELLDQLSAVVGDAKGRSEPSEGVGGNDGVPDIMDMIREKKEKEREDD